MRKGCFLTFARSYQNNIQNGGWNVHCIQGNDNLFFHKTLEDPDFTILLKFQVRQFPHLSISFSLCPTLHSMPTSSPGPKTTWYFRVSERSQSRKPPVFLPLSSPGNKICSASFSSSHLNSFSAAMQISVKCWRKIRLTKLIHSKVWTIDSH